jgi:arginase
VNSVLETDGFVPSPALSNGMRYAIIEAPSSLGLRSKGVEGLPAALLQHGLAERLHARRAGRVEPDTAPAVERDALTNTLNAPGIAGYTRKLADAIEPVFSQGEFPIVLGGDCTVLLGSALALRRRGRYGLLFIDGQADFFQPEAEPNGEAASMDLAFVTGHGPTLLTEFDGLTPLVEDSDAVAFGFRDAEDQIEYGSQPLPAELRAFDLPTIRQRGIVAVAREAVAHLSRPELRGFWIHVDADCLDDAIMPAVDFRLPGGLSASELQTVLSTALSSGLAVGLEITIYNPTLDTDGRAGRLLADSLVEVLSRFQY